MGIETKERTPEEQPILQPHDLKDPISRRTRSRTSMPTEDHLDKKDDKAEVEDQKGSKLDSKEKSDIDPK